MNNFMKYLPIIAALAIVGLLFLILSGIVSKYRYKARALVFLIFGLVLSLIFLGTYLIDVSMNKIQYSLLHYYSFIGAPLLYTIILVPILFNKGRRHYERGIKVKTILDKKDVLYILYDYNDCIYLNNHHQGITYNLGKKDFHDDVIKKIANKYKSSIKEENIEKIGEYIIKGKKDTIYHCYYAKLDKELVQNDYSLYNKVEVVNLNFNNLDRQIIFRILLKENFKVEITEEEMKEW